MSQVGILQFNKGMSTDIDKSFRDGTSYIRAENFTLSAIDGGTSGALENVKGNELVSDIVFDTNHEIVGYCNIVRDVVFFTTDGTDSNIYLYSNDVLSTIYSDSLSTTKLNFDKDDPSNRIVAVGREETSTVKKVYWVDGINELRYLDLNRDYSGKEADIFNVIPPNDLTININTEVVNGSGEYLAGTVYHAYQFYSKNGTSSTIGNFSYPIKLSKYTSIKDGGTIKDEDTGCSVNVNINGISSEILSLYDRVRLYSIFYDNNQIPVINIVAERPMPTNNISILDSGDSIGEITFSEFLSLKQTTYIPKAIESKNNNLFIGNIEESSFTSSAIDNWDARAYRFNPASSNGYIYSSDGSDEIEISPSTFKIVTRNGSIVEAGNDIPVDFDCVNKYNNIFEDSLAVRTADITKNNRYDSSGILGGEGLNIKYSFEQVSKRIDKSGDVSLVTGNKAVDHELTDNYAAASTIEKVIECESGEVYRVGIKFYNKKGQSSFVKWIGDILWEESFEGFADNKVDFAVPTTEVFNNAALLKVELKNTDLFTADPEIASWQIVRVKRESSDKSVKANGLLTPLLTWASESFYRPYVALEGSVKVNVPISDYNTFVADVSQNEFKFISPELMFNSDVNNILDGSKIRVYNKISNDFQSNVIDNFTLVNAQVALTNKSPEINYLGDVARSNLFEITDSLYVDPVYPDEIDSRKVSIGNISVLNQARQNYSITAKVHYGASCSGLLLAIGSNTLDNDPILGEDAHFYASVISNVDATRYGGLSYYDILNNEYIPFSDPVEVSTTDVYCRYGDTYTNMYYYMDTLLDDGKIGPDNSMQILNCFPVQSTIDLRYRQDRILDYYTGPVEAAAGTKDNFIQETVEQGILLFDVAYDTDLGDLYVYNPSYSAENNSSISFSKPFDFDEESILSTKVLASEKKINGEIEDNWTNFLSNNFIELDTAYGELNDLKVMDNNLFFWQDKGFGRLAVNDRSLITDESGAQLSLGTGSVLERYDYLSTEIGNTDKYNITSTENGLFWNYSNRNQLYRFNGNLEEISFSKAISKYVQEEANILPLAITDHSSKEVLFRIGDEMLVFDTMMDSFTGVFTFTPKWLIPLFDGSYLSSADSQAVYLHNSNNVNRGNFYGVDNDSTLKHIFVGDYHSTKVFDVLNWHSTSEANGVNNYEDTFNEYRIYNDYQNTDWQNITWKRKERSFNTIIPRDRINGPQSINKDIFDPLNIDATQSFKRRIRDKYIVLDMKYDNTNGNIFSVPSIQVGYRSSIR